MTLTTDLGHDGMELFNLLLRSTEEPADFLSDHPWTLTINNAPSPQRSDADDFLDALLFDSSSSSVPASPLWLPCATQNGINEDPLTDPADSPHPASCTAFPAFDVHALPQPPSLENQPPPNEEKPDVSLDFGWESDGCHKEFGLTCYLSKNQAPLLAPSHSLSVKDLLLSNLGQAAQRIPQHSLQELVLNEDEKKLLAKEGVNLPCKLPLSKSEERILKKIRRKIRNKHSAQESRKKKREYVDSLEGRMSACSTQNLKLQRKIQQLEETNNALLEQLNQLQALLPNSSSKTTNRGTCILVLLFSFSLLISSHLQPDPYSQRSHAEYAGTTASSRSLQPMDEAGDVPPPPPPHLPLPSASWGFGGLRSLKERLWAWTHLPTFHCQDHRHEGYQSHWSRNM
ncbi:cyclic AMP-responsive element-binding protein 3-like protein 3-A isoform X2 [Kryptolebias marmoratus]|uniref:Cyclic AMP-responsive element-binding protein 3-like protein 3-A n=1 Tax=Kryptolebias marmoratus TaxID=37003 RepID=A0A3Q2ZZ78_KRYMA|nr:cyclic AMP-responsive element-binding protein 3-like protein 3-A isoform X2 [Kryptolebias marmoratus]